MQQHLQTQGKPMRKPELGSKIYDRHNGNTLLVLKSITAGTSNRSDGENLFYQEFWDDATYETHDELAVTPQVPGICLTEITRIPVLVRLDAETKQRLPYDAEWFICTSLLQPGTFELRPAAEFTANNYRIL